MYVPAWPALNPKRLLGSRPASLPFPLGEPDALGFHVARGAIYHLFRALGDDREKTVLVPAYHHGNEVRAIRASGARVRFYSIDRKLQPDLDELDRLARRGAHALFVIHYLGWSQPVHELQTLCRERGMILVEDCALALLSEREGRSLGQFGDAAVFCLYKTLPVPNGGLLVTKRRLPGLEGLRLRGCGGLSLAARLSELALTAIRARWERLGRGLLAAKRATGKALTAVGARREAVGDDGFRPAVAGIGISSLTRALVRRSDLETIRLRRRRNFELLRDRLAGHVATLFDDLPEGVCPLFFPILVRDKGFAVGELARHGIESIPLWNQGDPEAEGNGFADVRFLRQHVLELPIHQDVTPEQVEYLAAQVLRLKLALPAH